MSGVTNTQLYHELQSVANRMDKGFARLEAKVDGVDGRLRDVEQKGSATEVCVSMMKTDLRDVKDQVNRIKAINWIADGVGTALAAIVGVFVRSPQ